MYTRTCVVCPLCCVYVYVYMCGLPTVTSLRGTAGFEIEIGMCIDVLCLYVCVHSGLLNATVCVCVYVCVCAPKNCRGCEIDTGMCVDVLCVYTCVHMWFAHCDYAP